MQRAAELAPGATFVEVGPGNVLTACSSGSSRELATLTLGTAG